MLPCMHLILITAVAICLARFSLGPWDHTGTVAYPTDLMLKGLLRGLILPAERTDAIRRMN